MRTNKAVAIILALLLVIVTGGLAWISGANIMPPAHQVEQAIPDANIPR